MANSVDPDETARYEPSHQDLHCLHKSSALIYRVERVNIDFLFGSCFLTSSPFLYFYLSFCVVLPLPLHYSVFDFLSFVYKND